MSKNKEKNSIRVIVALTFLIMIIVNALANGLPINGKLTGEVSDSYQNLFAPAGLTFAIWGLIYILLAGYTIYQSGLLRGEDKMEKPYLINNIGVYFSISSLANAAWIFSWHYDMIALSMVLMLLILICLIKIVRIIKSQQLTGRDRIFVRLPFSIYFGWITVATIANATVLLVSVGWNGFAIAEEIWAIAIIIIGMIIGTLTMISNRDIAYGFVLIWAYTGIMNKHTSSFGFSGQYPQIINTVMLCLVVFVLAEIYIIIFNKRNTSR